ncbi:hypothetical protein [Bifidobacterium sp.]|uniref:hypothetical protein n=1 Tax=Bifidobacterium sp. TaxID=41200 RepID=UPI0025BA9FD5|nr:hypothetical protein [Bifidobacterium sp.]MCH4209579.1 hypothetical protein [Bifidobacterium sp.]MCI1225022.1 hypothetical protein [Bifidobacterium sp.]
MSEQHTTPNANRDDDETENFAQASAQDFMDTRLMPAYENRVHDDAGATPAEPAVAGPADADGVGDETAEVLGAMSMPGLTENPAAKPVDATEGSDGTEMTGAREGDGADETVWPSAHEDEDGEAETGTERLTEPLTAVQKNGDTVNGGTVNGDTEYEGTECKGTECKGTECKDTECKDTECKNTECKNTEEEPMELRAESIDGSVAMDESESETMPEGIGDQPISAAAQEASASVPLYATEPPRGYDLPQGGYAPQDTQGEQAPWNPHRHHQGQPYVRVPREPQPLAPIVMKTGPSVPTIVFGTLGLVLGAVIGAFGLFFPMDAVINPVANARVAVAVVCAILGVILITVALIWALVSLLRRSGSHSDTEDARTSKPA